MTLHDIWVVLEPMLRPAIARSPDNPRVLAHLMSREAELWGIYEAGKPIAAITTWITGDRCRIWLVGGSRVREWVDGFIAKLSDYARSLGCVALYACGRTGWTRLASKMGWQPAEPIDGYLTWERRL